MLEIRWLRLESHVETSAICLSLSHTAHTTQETTMSALKSVQDIFKFMGLLLETDKPYSLQYVRNVLITLPMVLLLLPLCAYIVFNANNLLGATDVFYVIAATILCISQYWIFVMQKRPLFNLLAELQTLIDQSIIPNPADVFDCHIKCLTFF